MALDENSFQVLKAFAYSFPSETGLAAALLGCFAGIVLEAMPTPWSWVVSPVLLLLAIFLARGYLHGRFLGPVHDEQATQMHEWFVKSPRLTEAASRWASADFAWTQADFHLVRKAYDEERKLKGQKVPFWDPHLAGFSDLPRLQRFFERYLPVGWMDPSHIDLKSDQQVGDDWLERARALAPMDPGGYSPRERARLERCVARYKTRAGRLDKDPAARAEKSQAWVGWSGRHGLREGASWPVATLPVVGLLAGYVCLVLGTIIVSSAVVGLDWLITSVMGISTPPTLTTSLIQGVQPLIRDNPMTFLFLWGLSPLIAVAGIQAFRLVRHKIFVRPGHASFLQDALHGLPLSRYGRGELKKMVRESPRTASWFFAHAGPQLRQVEFRFFRELWHAMVPAATRDAQVRSKQKTRQAIRGLPATAAYEARLLAARMQAQLPDVDEKATLPRRARL